MPHTCDLGVEVDRCRSAQKKVVGFGEAPFYCENCNFETVVPRLVASFIEDDRKGVASLLKAFGFKEEASSVKKGEGGEVHEDAALCIYTQQKIGALCADTGCPCWVGSPWAKNCTLEARRLLNASDSLDTRSLAALYGMKEEDLKALLDDARFRAQEIFLETQVSTKVHSYSSGHPVWVHDIERRFSLPIEVILPRLGVDHIVNGYSLREEQRKYLNGILTQQEVGD